MDSQEVARVNKDRGFEMIELIKRICGLGLVIGFVVVSQAVYAQPNFSAPGKDPLQVYKDAGADAEQEAKIRELAHDFEVQAKVRFERLRNKLVTIVRQAAESNAPRTQPAK